GVLVRRRGGHDSAARQQHVRFEHTVVHEAAAKARRLDADADRRAAYRDVLQLRHDARHEAASKRVARDGLERREPLDVERARVGVEPDDVVELAEGDPLRRRLAWLVAEQVRDRRLRELKLTAAVAPAAREPCLPALVTL